jgi:hypothetical protein
MLSNTAFLALLVLLASLARSKLNFTALGVEGLAVVELHAARSLKV